MPRYFIQPKKEFHVPVDARSMSPDNIKGKSIKEILELPVWEGNSRLRLGEIFEVSCSPEPEDTVELIIDSSNKIRYVGYKMSEGRIIIEGEAGCFLGYKMKGGMMIVRGNADSWLGSKMKDGIIEVFGNAGDHLGSKLPGEKPGKGMSGGEIIVHGSAGSYIGEGMSGGRIIVEGSSGIMPGYSMIGGSIFIRGGCNGLPGARMVKGKIVIGGVVPRILPSFHPDSVLSKGKVGKWAVTGRILLLIGDSVVGGRGRLYLNLDLNKYLEELAELLEVGGVEAW